MKTYSLHIICRVVLCICVFCSCKQDHSCPNPNEKVALTPGNHVSYQGNEQIKFLHNNADTQVFVGQGKETYYITEEVTKEGECAKDHESTKVKFQNTTTLNILEYRYEWDKNLFGGGARVNAYTGFKFIYKGKTFTDEFYDAPDSTTIGTKKYAHVAFYGTDTNNYVARNSSGILRIRVNYENWDLIP